MASIRGQSAVVVPVIAAEPLVASWRNRFDASAAQGIPAHITALYPFLSEDRLDDGVIGELRGLCEERPVLDVAFRKLARFPEVIYLDPDPADGLKQLTAAIARRWPEAPPYGGAFDDVVPHLTIAHSVEDGVLDEVERAITPSLPVVARLTEAQLHVFDGQRWNLRASLPFGVSCSHVRHVLGGEHERIRQLRLGALAADPDAFGSTYERDAAQPTKRWEEWVQQSELGTDQRTFVLEAEDGRWLGLALVRIDDKDSESAVLNAMWVAPDARGRREAARLCDACAAWATERGCQRLTLTVVTDNEGARRAYEAAGFSICGETTWVQDGRTLEEFVMVRAL